MKPNLDNPPKNYLSASDGTFRIISQGMPLCSNKSTVREALAVAEQFKIKLSAWAWNGDCGEFIPLLDD